MKKTGSILMVCALALAASGCASLFRGVPAGDDAIYERGTLRAVVAAPLPKVDEATRAAMEELRFVAVDPVADRLKATVRARMADGTKVRVTLEALDFESTVVRIKVGSFGDDSVSIQILKHIKRRL